MEMIRRAISFNKFLVVDGVGRRGGLTMMWKDSIDAQVQFYSHCHINLLVNDPLSYKEWLLTGFYGHAETSKRVYCCNLLKNLNQNL